MHFHKSQLQPIAALNYLGILSYESHDVRQLYDEYLLVLAMLHSRLSMLLLLDRDFHLPCLRIPFANFAKSSRTQCLLQPFAANCDATDDDDVNVNASKFTRRCGISVDPSAHIMCSFARAHSIWMYTQIPYGI